MPTSLEASGASIWEKSRLWKLSTAVCCSKSDVRRPATAHVPRSHLQDPVQFSTRPPHAKMQEMWLVAHGLRCQERTNVGSQLYQDATGETARSPLAISITRAIVSVDEMAAVVRAIYAALVDSALS